jgi:membrane peptidoglycan carboxypeptidase
MMKGVIENGTGSRLVYKYGIKNPVAGKTGTPQDNSDGRFIGMVPQLVTGVWTGYEDRAFHFRITRLGENLRITVASSISIYPAQSCTLKSGNYCFFGVKSLSSPNRTKVEPPGG